MEDETQVEVGGTQSLFDQIRARRKEIADATTIDLPLPGYEDLLVARYRVLDVKNEINRISQNAAKSGGKSQLARALNAALDTLVASCVEIFAVKDDELVPLAEGIGPDEAPVRYDERLAEFMGVESSSARETVLGVFGNNEAMVMDHAAQLSRWMSNTTREVDDAWSGEMLRSS